MTAYYNEFDPFAADWLEALIQAGEIAPGIVDRRSITDVCQTDLVGFDQCHFFAGIGGWSLALRLAGWPDDRPVWTGSCPCQPFSCAGEGTGHSDHRHLWPDFHRIITARRPPVVFGEQVGGADGEHWLAGVYADLESQGYRVPKDQRGNYEMYDIPAAGVGAPQIRQRLYWCADTPREHGEAHGCVESSGSGRPPIATGGFPRIFSDGTWAETNGRGERLPTIVRSFNGLSKILAGFGNAIVPELAAEFIAAYMECT